MDLQSGWEGMTLSTTDVWLGDRALDFLAIRRDLHPPLEQSLPGTFDRSVQF